MPCCQHWVNNYDVTIGKAGKINEVFNRLKAFVISRKTDEPDIRVR
tara:strand:- start:1883 stop:2020 length:138 start_codon:yes stop_codon:yes gene_type:complete